MFKNSIELSWLIRRHSVEMMMLSQSSHLAGVLSEADILGVLFSGFLRCSPNININNKDYFILSKGHCCAGLYAALAENGFFAIDCLKKYCENSSFLPGHASHFLVPGVDVSSGSLGHGLSFGLGIAYALKKNGMSNKVVVMVGDGECEEGSVWEASLLASALKLSNLYLIVDNNRMQALDFTNSIVNFKNLDEKFNSFGFEVKVVDGHNHREIEKALTKFSSNSPKCLICNTTKGKGISFMENDILWHYRYPHPNGEYEQAIKELNDSKPPLLADPYLVR